MSGCKTRVCFCVNVGDNVCIDESKVRNHFDIYKDKLLRRADHSGALIISINDQDEIRIIDELQNAVPYICFESLSFLSGGNSFVYSYFEIHGVVNFTPYADHVDIFGDCVPRLSFPIDELMSALYNCGMRYIDYFQLLRGEEWREVINEFVAAAERAKQALLQYRAARFDN